jgi:hypothetical protein
MPAMKRHGKINGMGIVLTFVFSYVGLVGVRFASMHWANMAAQDVVLHTAFTWRDLNKVAAENFLNKELRRLSWDVDGMCGAEDEYGCCKLYEESSERHIYCWWWDGFKYPLLDKYHWRQFESHRIVGSGNQVYKGEGQL